MEKKSYVQDFQRKTTVGTQSLSFFPSAYESEEEKNFFYFFSPKDGEQPYSKFPEKALPPRPMGLGRQTAFLSFLLGHIFHIYL